MDMTSEAGAEYTSDMTSEMEADFEETNMQGDELALLAFSAQPTVHSSSQQTSHVPEQQVVQKTETQEYDETVFSEGDTAHYDSVLNRSHSAPAEDRAPSSPAHPRALSAPIVDNVVPSSSSFSDFASLLFDSSSVDSAISSQSSSTSVASSTAPAHNPRYPYMYNAPPLHRSAHVRSHFSTNHSDGENDSRALSRKPNRQATSSAEDLFELLYAPAAPSYYNLNKSSSLNTASYISFFGNRTAPTPQAQRQPLTRVPSFGTPWAPGSPPKVNAQLF